MKEFVYLYSYLRDKLLLYYLSDFPFAEIRLIKYPYLRRSVL